jgi:vancomycin permeability regulator SanA
VTTEPPPRVPRRRWWRRRTVLAIILGALLAVAFGPWATVRVTTAADIHGPGDAPRPAQAALVLGAGLAADGTPSPFLRERVATGAQLYRDGRVRVLLLSGDNSRRDYDEVTAMADIAAELGVPATAIVLDYAGFDSYSSCYRARHVFGATSVIVVSQQFHLPRAVWLCQRLGLDTQGIYPPASYSDATRRGNVREVPATAKAVLDVVTRREPAFAGPRESTLQDALGRR